jgi:hypothetical protein
VRPKKIDRSEIIADSDSIEEDTKDPDSENAFWKDKYEELCEIKDFNVMLLEVRKMLLGENDTSHASLCFEFEKAHEKWMASYNDIVNCPAESFFSHTRQPGTITAFFAFTPETEKARAIKKKIQDYYTQVLPMAIPARFRPLQHVKSNSTTETSKAMNDDEKPCSACGAKDSFISDEKHATMVCMACGTVDTSVHLENFTFKDLERATAAPSSRRKQPYNPRSHFKDHVENMQGVESTPIPFRVQEGVLQRLKQLGVDPIKNYEKVTRQCIIKRLEELRMPEYYAHATKIIRLITNNKGAPEPLEPEEMEVLTRLFDDIIKPFEEIKHKAKRNNIPKYQYLLMKLCQMVGLTRFLPYLSSFDAKSKESEAERVWMSICNKNKGKPYWQYIPTPL